MTHSETSVHDHLSKVEQHRLAVTDETSSKSLLQTEQLQPILSQDHIQLLDSIYKEPITATERFDSSHD